MLITLGGGSGFEGKVTIPSSKSYAHRSLICAALADKNTRIYGSFDSDDVKATVDCLRSMGAEIEINRLGCEVSPIWDGFRKDCVFNCRESGSTLRFLLPVASVLGINGHFTGTGRLGERPVKGLLECMRQKGVTATDTFPYEVSGELKSGVFFVEGNVSSQYVTGLLLALPTYHGYSKIRVKGGVCNMQSKGYVDMTIEVMKAFSVDAVEEKDFGYMVKGQKFYRSPKEYVLEGDWSGAGYFLAAGAVNGEVTLRGLKYPSIQRDCRIVDIIREAGGNVAIDEGGIHVKKSNLRPLEVDCSDIPDMAPILSVLCAAANGVSKLTGVERLRYKESDRLSAIIEMLNACGVKTCYENGELYIVGGKEIKGCAYDGKNDHRMVMSEAILSSLGSGKSTISGAEAVTKSYPSFFKEYAKIGGIIVE